MILKKNDWLGTLRPAFLREILAYDQALVGEDTNEIRSRTFKPPPGFFELVTSSIISAQTST